MMQHQLTRPLAHLVRLKFLAQALRATVSAHSSSYDIGCAQMHTALDGDQLP